MGLQIPETAGVGPGAVPPHLWSTVHAGMADPVASVIAEVVTAGLRSVEGSWAARGRRAWSSQGPADWERAEGETRQAPADTVGRASGSANRGGSSERVEEDCPDLPFDPGVPVTHLMFPECPPGPGLGHAQKGRRGARESSRNRASCGF